MNEEVADTYHEYSHLSDEVEQRVKEFVAAGNLTTWILVSYSPQVPQFRTTSQWEKKNRLFGELQSYL